MRRAGVNIRPAVDQERYSCQCRKKRGKRRPLYTFDPAHEHLTSYKDSSRASGRYKCVSLSVLYHLHRNHDRRIFLSADCLYRRFSSLDHLRGIDDLDLVLRPGILCEFIFDHILLTCQQDLNVFPLLYCLYSTLYDLNRSIIPAHRVKGNFRNLRHFLSS